MSKAVRLLVLVWAGLLVLLAATTAAAFAPLGPFKPVVNLGIAFAKAALVFWVFMDLKAQTPLARLFAVGALAWLLILIAMSLGDAATRSLFGS